MFHHLKFCSGQNVLGLHPLVMLDQPKWLDEEIFNEFILYVFFNYSRRYVCDIGTTLSHKVWRNHIRTIWLDVPDQDDKEQDDIVVFRITVSVNTSLLRLSSSCPYWKIYQSPPSHHHILLTVGIHVLATQDGAGPAQQSWPWASHGWSTDRPFLRVISWSA